MGTSKVSAWYCLGIHEADWPRQTSLVGSVLPSASPLSKRPFRPY